MELAQPRLERGDFRIHNLLQLGVNIPVLAVEIGTVGAAGNEEDG